MAAVHGGMWRQAMIRTKNPCFSVQWEIAFEYGDRVKENAWVVTDGSVPESDGRVGVILKDIPVGLAKHLVHVHNRSLT
jgi:hypothetical protein